jgi:hypothetical protein
MTWPNSSTNFSIPTAAWRMLLRVLQSVLRTVVTLFRTAVVHVAPPPRFGRVGIGVDRLAKQQKWRSAHSGLQSCTSRLCMVSPVSQLQYTPSYHIYIHCLQILSSQRFALHDSVDVCFAHHFIAGTTSSETDRSQHKWHPCAWEDKDVVACLQ